MILANPVRGTIYERPGDRPKGSRSFWMTQEFGCTGFPWEPPKGDCAHFHRGLDFANGYFGRAVLAAAAGVVRISQREPNGEHIVAIHHGSGLVSFYGHLLSRSIAAGKKVTKGQKIGDVGSSGNSTGPHLHFALKQEVNLTGGANLYPDGNGRWIDPWPRLAQNVTVHPVNEPGINIRLIPDTGPDTIYAVTRSDGLIHRTSDEADLGPIVKERKWGGTVTGKRWELPDGTTGRDWDRILLDDDYRFLASALARRSAS